MIDCPLTQQPDGTYRCPVCGWTYHKLARRNCPGANGQAKRTATRATRRPCGKRGITTESRTVLIDVIDQLLGMTPPVPDEQINRLYARLTCLEMRQPLRNP